MSFSAAPGAPLRVERAMYGGKGLAHTAAGAPVLVPFALPGELIRLNEPSKESAEVPSPQLAVLEPSPDRAAPHCVHFGVCGGCQYQMAAYPAQLAIKGAILIDLLHEAGVNDVPELLLEPSPEPYGYRNRIRLRVTQRLGGAWHVGYSVRGTNDFLPVTMCPIAAPLLWRAAEAFLTAARTNRDVARVLGEVEELELFCDGVESRLQATLLGPGEVRTEPKAFARAMEQVRILCPELAGAGVVRVDPRSGHALETTASWGAAGLPYRVADQTYWITRGGFFQVNRFLLPRLVELVCGGRSGRLAWDLFAGVGLFSRVLAGRFEAVTAVEANPVACGDLRRALATLGARNRAVEGTTLAFLRRAVLERDRPELIVLDPPRAGAGEEACRLLARLAPAEIVYLSCDPETLARDLAVITRSGYRLTALHLIDLFPQTYHLETLAVLRRADEAPQAVSTYH